MHSVQTHNAVEMPAKAAIQEQLERIIATPDFAASARAREFLRFVVDKALEGDTDGISQYAIATEVFGRGAGFDPATDPIVRMVAGHIRRRLEHYYLSAGASDPLLITIPKGTYVPVFEMREIKGDAPGSSGSLPARGHSADTWPTLLLTPLLNLTGDEKSDYISQGLIFDLANEMSHYEEFRVLLGAGGQDPGVRQSGADFELRGTLTGDEATLKISVQLLNASSSVLIWGDTYSPGCAGPSLGAFQQELAKTLATVICSERGMVARHVGNMLNGRKPSELNAYEAIIKYLHFSHSPSPESYQVALTALQNAVHDHPDSGTCWSFLARLHADNYILGPSPEAGLIDTALAYAKKGVQLNPVDQRCRGILGYVYLLYGAINEARSEAEKALALNPNSLLILEGIGYLLTLTGDWNRGPELSRKAIRLNPFHLSIVHAGLWLDALRREDFEDALLQARAFMNPGIFWDPLMRAVALAGLNRRDDAASAAAELLRLQPDFSERGDWLIRLHVKFEPLVEQIEGALGLAGIHVKRTLEPAPSMSYQI